MNRSLACAVFVVAVLILPSVLWADGADVPDGPVQVFILAGQSNMVGHGKVEKGRDPANPENKNAAGGIGSLRYMVNQDPDRYGAGGAVPLVNEKGDWAVRNDVWIWSTTDKERPGKLTCGFGHNGWIGPEFGFGHVMGNHLGNPVLIIKTAWGGKSLAQDFRPPSSEGETGPYYEKMITLVNQVLSDLEGHFPQLQNREYEIAGFGWHQGWNDRINDSFVRQYEQNLANLIRDVREDLGVEDLPVVVATTGMGGSDDYKELAREQAAVAGHDEFKDTVAVVRTRKFWRPPEKSPSKFGYHWCHNGETHYLIGDAMGRAMKQLIGNED